MFVLSLKEFLSSGHIYPVFPHTGDVPSPSCDVRHIAGVRGYSPPWLWLHPRPGDCDERALAVKEELKAHHPGAFSPSQLLAITSPLSLRLCHQECIDVSSFGNFSRLK